MFIIRSLGMKHDATSKGKSIPFILPLIIRYNTKEKLPIGIIAEVNGNMQSSMQILSFLDNANIPVEYFAYYKVGDRKIAVVIADLHVAGGNTKNLFQKMKKSQAVKNLEIVYPRTDGILIMKNMQPLSFNNEKIVLQSSEHFYSIIEGLSEASGGALLWHFWYRGGKHVYEASRRIRNENSIETLKDALLSCEVSGWWEASRIVSYDNYRESARIRLWNNWECSEIKKKIGITDKPQSHLVRGFLSGLFSGHFGLNMIAEETKCIAKNDPYCEFVITQALE